MFSVFQLRFPVFSMSFAKIMQKNEKTQDFHLIKSEFRICTRLMQNLKKTARI